MAVNNTSLQYPHPNASTFTDFVITYPNETVLPGIYGPMFFVSLFFITFVNLQFFTSTRKAFAASAFVNFIVSVLSVPLGLAGTQTWAVSLILLVTAILMANRTAGGVST